MQSTQTESNVITLYTEGTPSGHKASVTLEELGVKYDVRRVDFSKGEHKEEWFAKVSPNSQIPVIVDKSNNNFTVFESGAIMLYLVDKYDKDHKISFEKGTNHYYEMLSWLFFHNAGVAPMQGQHYHFTKMAPEKIDYAINRYHNETRRLYSVLEARLKQNGDWLVGDKMTIADLANYTWVNVAFFTEIDLSEFPKLSEWKDRISAREGVQRGLDVPFPFFGKQQKGNTNEEPEKDKVEKN